MITESRLRSLIRKLIFENVATYRRGRDAKQFAGGDSASNIPALKGVNIDIRRDGNDIGNPSYSVAISAEDEGNKDLNVMQVFRDEEEARKFARDKAEQIKRDPRFSIS